jgi:hypothetical protein
MEKPPQSINISLQTAMKTVVATPPPNFDESLFRELLCLWFLERSEKWRWTFIGCVPIMDTSTEIPCSTHDFIQEILVKEWGMDGNDPERRGCDWDNWITHHQKSQKIFRSPCVEPSMPASADSWKPATNPPRDALKKGLIHRRNLKPKRQI